MSIRILRYFFVVCSILAWAGPASAQLPCPLPPVPALGVDTIQHVATDQCARETCRAQNIIPRACGFRQVLVTIGTEERRCSDYHWQEGPVTRSPEHSVLACCPDRDIQQPDGSCGAPNFDDGMGSPVCKGRGDDGNPWAASTSSSFSTVPAGVGDPINVANGNQYIQQDDLVAEGLRTLSFSRHYNSNPYTQQPSTLLTPGASPWRTSWDFAISPGGSQSGLDTFYLERPNGLVLTFSRRLDGSWVDGRGNTTSDLSEMPTGGFSYSTDGQRREFYDADGRLLRITDANSRTVELSHGPAGPVEIRSPFGQTLTLSYDAAGRLDSVVDSAGRLVRYGYDAADRLVEVTAPDGGTRQYLYEDTSAGHLLTGIVDATGERVATFGYQNGIATSSEGANGADRVDVFYAADGTATVTDTFGKQSIYRFQRDLTGRAFLTAIEGQPIGDCLAADTTYTLDEQGRPTRTVDANGNVTLLSYDAQGLLTEKVEAAGTPDERFERTVRLPGTRLVSRMEVPGRTTELTYDGAQRVTSRTEIDTATGERRTTAYTYNAEGQVLTIDGPRTDVADVTTFTYDADGNVATVTDANGLVSVRGPYDASGRPLAVTDVNSVVTAMTYDDAGRLTSATTAGATTTRTYDAAGRLASLTLPDGSATFFEYDAAGRETARSNNLGERIERTLDAQGGLLLEETLAVDGTVTRVFQQTFDELHRASSIGGADPEQKVSLTYDANDNLLSTIDPLGRETRFTVDALDRVQSTVDARGGVVQEDFDGRGNPIGFSDPRQVTTTSLHNGFDELVSEDSPDRGLETFEYDPAGNVVRVTEGRGIPRELTYDATNRLLRVHYPTSPSEDIAYTYDDCPLGAGRLCAVSDESGTVSFAYDARGNRVRELRTFAGDAETFETRYTYNLADRLVETIYPSGRIVRNHHDDLGRIREITTLTGAGAAEEIVVTAVEYQPFGPATGWTTGNGLTTQLTYDMDYQLRARRTFGPTGEVQDLSYELSARGEITAILDALDPSRSEAFAYDEVGRLIEASGPYGAIGYTYDGTGNRLSRTLGAVPAEPGSTGSGAGASVEITDPVLAEEYLYDESSNRLLEVTFREEGAITAALALDYTSDGNVTAERVAESLRSLGYDARGRLAEVFEDGRPVARYTYDAFGRRATKTGLQTVEAQRRYLYDERGRLIAEVQDDGSIARELIYLGDLQVAVVIPPGSTGTGGAGAASEQEVDNLSPDFAASSAWAASQAQSGFAGFNYRFTAANGSIVLDNLLAFVPGETRVEIVGSWPTSSRNAGFLFENYAAKLAGDGSAFVRWSLGDEPAGQYRVRVNYTSNPELRASDAPYTIAHLDAAGQPASTTVRVDQRTGGGTLVDLGVYSLDSTSSVTLTDAADGPVVADAVVFEPLEPIADPATWTFTVAEGGRQDLYASWSTSTHNTPAARYSVTRTTAAGIDTTVSVEVDQSESSDGFATLKSLDAAAGDQIVVELSNLGPALFVVADAVRLVTGESTAGDSEAEGLFFVHGDHLDTPQVLTDSEGAEAWRGIHQPFGRTTVLVDRLTHDERFAGQLEDAETGLFYNGFRSTYDPDLGRYLEGDPIGLAGGINPYVYVENNPLSLVDPDGLAPRVRISSGKDNEITRKLLEKLKKEAPRGCNVSILGVNFSPKYAMAIQAGVGEGIASGAECDLTPTFAKKDPCDIIRAQAFEETFNIAGQRYNCCTAKRKKIKGGFGFECAEDPLAGLPDPAVCNAV